MEYQEFRKRILKTNSKHHYEITNSYWNKDAWRWIKKNKWLDIGQEVSERDFGKIIKAINKTLQDNLIAGKDVVFPHRMGMLEIRKYKVGVSIKDGKLKINLPIDFKRTLELWHEDEESYKNKKFVRHEAKEGFKIYYNKAKANYNNKSFYQFIPTRTIKIRLKNRILNGGRDALLLQKSYGIY